MTIKELSENIQKDRYLSMIIDVGLLAMILIIHFLG